VRLGAAKTVVELGVRQYDADTILKRLDDLGRSRDTMSARSVRLLICVRDSPPGVWLGKVTTASKTIDKSTYWRCSTCGEVWNVTRRHETMPDKLPDRW
jgi:hypothetical protein